jgi:hypothetical protein
VLLSDWLPPSNAMTNSAPSPGREEPEVFLEDVLDARLPFPAEGRDPALAFGHDRPLGGLVPVQLTNAARLEVHVHAGDLVRNREIVLRGLARPAAALLAPGRDVERGPEERLSADVRPRRGDHVGNWLSSTGFRGPAIFALAGSPMVFSMPSWGKSGFPKVGVSWCGTWVSFEPVKLYPPLCSFAP